mgnify:FL=1
MKRELTSNELCLVIGGLDLTGTLINAFTSGIKVILDVGRSLGTSFRRLSGNNLCPVK